MRCPLFKNFHPVRSPLRVNFQKSLLNALLRYIRYPCVFRLCVISYSGILTLSGGALSKIPTCVILGTFVYIFYLLQAEVTVNGTSDTNQADGLEAEIPNTPNPGIDTNAIRHHRVEISTEAERFRSPKPQIPNSPTKKSAISKTRTESGKK